MQTKRIIIILMIVILVALLGFVGYYFYNNFFKSDANPAGSDGQGDLGSFFPFGTSTPQDQTFISPFYQGNANNEFIPRLRKISEFPVSGYIVYERVASSSPIDNLIGNTPTSTQEEPTERIETVIRYFDKATGHIYETTADSLTRKRISNTTINGIEEVLFGANSSFEILRYEDEGGIIKTLIGSVFFDNTSTSTEQIDGTLSGFYTLDNIQSLSLSPNKNRFLFTDGLGRIFSSDNKESSVPTLLRALDFTEFLVDWAGENTAYITTKADSRADGYFYSLNTNNGSLNKLLGPLSGLTTNPSPDGEKIFASFVLQNQNQASIIDLDDNISTTYTIETLAEKCVWSKKGAYIIFCATPIDGLPSTMPQDWYQGKVQFTDYLWQYYLDNNVYTLVASEEELENNEFDMISLSLDPSETFIYFINKKDLTLWSFDLLAQ